MKCADLVAAKPDSIVRVAGVVLIRQRPGSAKGVIFVTLEDETGIANLIVWPHKMERYRRTVIGSYVLGVEGKLQREGIVTHVVSEKLHDFTYRLSHLTSGEVLEPGPINSIRDIPGNTPKTKPRMPGSRDFR